MVRVFSLCFSDLLRCYFIRDLLHSTLSSAPGYRITANLHVRLILTEGILLCTVNSLETLRACFDIGRDLICGKPISEAKSSCLSQPTVIVVCRQMWSVSCHTRHERQEEDKFTCIAVGGAIVTLLLTGALIVSNANSVITVSKLKHVLAYTMLCEVRM